MKKHGDKEIFPYRGMSGARSPRSISGLWIAMDGEPLEMLSKLPSLLIAPNRWQGANNMTDLVVTFDGTEYILLKDLCAMTGLKPYDVTMSDLAQGQIIERPPEGRQRKPRQYITVKAWLALWERVFRLWLVERSTGGEFDDLVANDNGVWTRKPWHWYGIDKIAEMFELEPRLIGDTLIARGYTARGNSINGPTAVQGIWANDKAKATGWIRNFMPEPSPCGKWHIHIVLDVAHPEFTKFLVELKGWPVELAADKIKAELQIAANIRSVKRRVMRNDLPVEALTEAEDFRLVCEQSFHAYLAQAGLA